MSVEITFEDLGSQELAEYLKQTQEEAIAEATANGMEVIIPDKNTITLDLDNEESKKRFEEALPLARNIFGIEMGDMWVSKSGNEHRTLHIPTDLTPERRILLQACLGSDPKRELLSLRRAIEGNTEPTVLFRPGPSFKA